MTDVIQMDMARFADCLGEIARPVVRAALVREVTQMGSEAWAQEVEHNVKALLSDKTLLDGEAQKLAGWLGEQCLRRFGSRSEIH